jgi:Winged helix DNA-binding domain
VGATASDTALAALQAERAFACRLTPDRALETLDDAEEFLRERGLLTRTPCCSLPSLFGACHEEPYSPDTPGFGQWPRTKWGWSFALPRRRGVYSLKIHHRRKTLYVTDEVARLIDPIARDELERMRGADPDWALVLDHLAAAGPSTSEDLKTELSLKPRELKAILYPLELCGTIVTRAIEPTEEGTVEGFEYARWDDLFPDPVRDANGIEELVVAAVRSAVLATEREVARWFPWRWRFEPALVDRLVSEGRLERPAPGWLAAPRSA